jgi:hypothetical protein
MKEFTLNPELRDLEIAKLPKKAIAWFVAVETGLTFLGIEKEKGIFSKIKSLFKA